MSRNDDIIEVQQLLAKYAVTMTTGDIDGVVSVFTPDGTYSAFGDVYTLDQFPRLVEVAPSGLFMTGTPLLDLADDGTGTGTQPLCFIDHTQTDIRIGYYKDTYLRTDNGWRLRTRAMTFIRRNGEHNSGRPHVVDLARD
ncbi:nuclear transport factor 2 family protein [Gordonia sp. CPCC 206044]|uniref:nuclear transport factor 2 family protein n=1 Tax=Gordonia sp. CPCC 206044 TaxID=3140793 RepID=UPI003AF3515E